MNYYLVEIPATLEQSNFNLIVSGHDKQEGLKEALWHYNRGRDHDGQLPVSKLPRGATITKKTENFSNESISDK